MKQQIFKSQLSNSIWQINLQDNLLEKINLLKNSYNISYLTSFVLISRQHSLNEIEEILTSSPNLNLNASELHNTPVFHAILATLMQTKEPVTIISDYDVDGICAAVIITEFCEHFQIPYTLILPSRQDGYGITQQMLNSVSTKFLITLDCGSSQVELMKTYSFTTIVVDHHRTICQNLQNVILINPNNLAFFQEEFASLCATTLIFLILQPFFKQNHTWLNLCAIATICDVMLINKTNKYFIENGLKNISERLGLFYLMQNSNIKNEINEKDVAFKIGPKLNAAGRIDNPIISFNLLKAKTEKEAIDFIIKIEQINNSRKDMQQEIFEEAIVEAKKQENEPIVVVFSENWNIGIVGIIAAKLQEELKKPCIVGFLNGEKIVKASARSNSLNLGYLFEKALQQNIILSGGGHKFAAGLSFKQENLEELKNFIKSEQNEQKTEINSLDAIANIEDISSDFHKLKPFGPNHKEPVVLLKNIVIKDSFEKNNYLCVTLLQNFQTMKLFVFKKELIEKLKEMKLNSFNCVLKLELNNFHQILDIV